MARFRFAVMSVGVAMLAAVAPVRAGDIVAPDDPNLISKMTDACLSAALTSGGIDKRIKTFCQCSAPILSRHMTPDSRYRLAVENRTDVQPDYDDRNATYDDVLKACPPGN